MRRSLFTIIYNEWLSVTFKGNNDDYLVPAPKERHQGRSPCIADRNEFPRNVWSKKQCALFQSVDLILSKFFDVILIHNHCLYLEQKYDGMTSPHTLSLSIRGQMNIKLKEQMFAIVVIYMEHNRRVFLKAQQKSISISNPWTPQQHLSQTLNLALQLPWMRSKSPQSKLRRLALESGSVIYLNNIPLLSYQSTVTCKHSSDAHCTDVVW